MALTLKPKPKSPPAKAEAAPKPVKVKKPRKKRESGGRSKFVLIIGEEGSILIYMRGSMVLRRLFAPSPQPIHTDTMVELMQAHPKVPLSILADVIDQQYVRQSFPPVSSLSVKGLVNRRLERDFQPEDIKGSLPLGRDKTGRKEWNYLLIGLAKTPLLQSWLDLLLELPNQLTGIFLLPVETTRYIAMLHKAFATDKGKGWKLLVSHNKVSGFRQVVTRDGKLVFTRVTQALDDSIPAVIAGNIEQEIIGTLEYLKRLGLPDNEALEAWVIVSQDIRDVLDTKRFNFGLCQVLMPVEVAEGLGLEQAALSADRFGDVVMAAAIARDGKSILRLSTSYADKLRQLYQVNMGVIAVGVLAILAMVVFASWNVYDMLGQNTSAQDFQNRKAALQPQLLKLKASVDGLNKDVAFKAAVMGASDAYVKPFPTPTDFVEELAPFLDDTMRATLFDWGPAAKANQLEIRVTLVFDATYKGVTELDARAAALQELLKEKMPEYDISHDPYGWSGGGTTGAPQEIAIDSAGRASDMAPAQRTAVIIFRGPIKGKGKDAATSNGAPTP